MVSKQKNNLQYDHIKKEQSIVSVHVKRTL